MARQTGKLAQAELHAKRVLAIQERAIGPDHVDVSESLSHLVAIVREAGREKEAEALEKRAAEILAAKR